MTTNPVTTPFNAQSTAAEVIAGVDLTGRRAIVTGGASGIGVETARALASAGAEVTLAVRDLAAGERTAEDITGTTGNKAVLVAPLDLADRASVAAFVAGWDGPLHILVNNAGVMASPLTRTAGGLGAAVRHQPPRPLRAHHRAARGAGRGRRRAGRVGQLRPGTCAAASTSTTSTSSTASTTRGSPTASRRPPTSCSRSRRPGAGPTTASTTNALMPGAIRTNLQRYVDEEELNRMRTRMGTTTAVAWKTPEQGAATSVLLAASPLRRRRRRPVLRGLQRGRAEPARYPSGRRGLRAGPGGRQAAVGGLRGASQRLTIGWASR